MLAGTKDVNTRKDVLTGAPQAVRASTASGGRTYTQVKVSGRGKCSRRPQARSPLLMHQPNPSTTSVMAQMKLIWIHLGVRARLEEM